jgi:hypothetical protein
MGALWVLVPCLAAGVVLRHSALLPENAPARLNGYVINVPLPSPGVVSRVQAPLDASFVQVSLTS